MCRTVADTPHAEPSPNPRRAHRVIGALTAGVLAVAGLPLLTASEAVARSCAHAPSVLRSRPQTHLLAGGATMRTWQTGAKVSRDTSVRIVAVSIPPTSTLRTKIYHAGALTRHKKVKSMAAAHRKAIVVVNGSVYQTRGAGVPASHFVASSQLAELSRKPSSTLSITSDGKARLAMLRLSGHVQTPRGRLALNAVNTPKIAGSGVTVYTPGWGTKHHPHGSVELIVKGGKVVATRSVTQRGARVSPNSLAITATGSAASALRKLRRGSDLTVTYAPSAAWQDAASKPRNAAVKPVAALDLGARVLRAGKVVTGDCNRRDETRRPRTAIGWKRDGTMIIMTVTARSATRDAAMGGATSAQVGMYLQQMGAVDGSKLDGGTSTVMFVRFTPRGPLHRVDRPGYAFSASVSNAVGVELP